MKLCRVSASVKSQYIAAFTINLISFGHGLALGWMSPMLPILQSDESPLATGKLTVEQTSWIGSLVTFGGITGNYFYVFLSDRYGRKFALNLMAYPQIAFWVIVMLGNSYSHLYIARVFAGFTGGGCFAALPLYIADIAEPVIRGQLGSMLMVNIHVGVLVSFIIGAFASYTVFPYTTFLVPVIFAVLILFFPETPQSLVKANKLLEASKSYKFYRGVKNDENLTQPQSEEFEQILSKALKPTEKREFRLKDFGSRPAIKGLTIAITLMALNQFSGGYVLVTYAGPIFRDAGSSLSPNLSAIILASLELLGSYVALILVDKLGRKILLVISLGGTSLGMGVLGGYLYIRHVGYDVTGYGFIPVVSLSFVTIVSCTGIITLSFIMLAEVLPAEIRSIGTSISLTILTSLGFVLLKFFPILSVHIELFGCFWIFSLVSGLGVLFIVFVVPETKGKNLNKAEPQKPRST